MTRTRMRYGLVTPARDAARTIGHTIDAVTTQRALPDRWVIVSDGSTDGTDDLVAAHAAVHPFICLLRRERDGRAGFASKVAAFQQGVAALADLPLDLVGNLDADVSFGPTYMQRLLAEFEADPTLGVAGGAIWERVGGALRPVRASERSVAGAVQLFRRQALEAIDGLLPLSRGGEDAVAEVMVRMRGWTARTVPELVVEHHGRVLGGASGVVRARFARGARNYVIGYHPIFQLGAGVYRMADRPYVVGGLSMVAGYTWAAVRRLPRETPWEVRRTMRLEQLARLGLRPQVLA